MKHTKKLIAILICLAMLPWTLIPVFADGQAEDNVLYSMTFDKSGDEEERMAEWNFDTACSINTIDEESGYLKVQSSGWGTGIELDDPFVASTFTAQLTYRWVSTGGDGIIAGTDQIQWKFDDFDDYQWQVEGHEGFNNTDTNTENDYEEGSSCLRRWGNTTTGGANANAMVNADIVTEWKKGEWVTATIEVLEGHPINFTFECNGKTQTFNYQSRWSSNILGSENSYMRFYFIYQPVEIYDFRVVEGVTFAPNRGDELYSMTFDKSGDEASKIAGWRTADNFTTAYSNDGFLKITGNSGFGPMTNIAGKIANVGTFTAQFTYRHSVEPANVNEGIGIAFGDYSTYNEVAVWRAYEDQGEQNGETGSSRTPYWGDRGYQNMYGIISADYVKAFADGEWITVTLEVEGGKPKTLKYETKGLEALKMNYTGTVTNLGASNIGLRFRSTNVELYDFRVVYGIGNDLTAKNDNTVEMIGYQKHNTEPNVRFIAKVKDLDVENVRFVIQATKTDGTTVTVGQCYVSEAITSGYTGIVETTDNGAENVEAGEGELFVVFVIRNLNLADYDYSFTVSAVAGSSQSLAQTYTVQ